MLLMKTIQGDLIKLALDGRFDVIVHGCNCFCTMGKGIAKTIKETFPAAYEADCEETEKGDRDKLGSFSYATIPHEGREITVVNAYTQYHWRGKEAKADYEAIREVMRKVKKHFTGLRIGYPRIGAGLAKGDWSIIAQIIEAELAGEEHTLVEFVPD